MANFAAVDVGSNAIRMRICSMQQGSPDIEHVLFRREPIRMGKGVFGTGRLNPQEFDSAIDVLKDFTRQIREHDVVTVRSVATSAVREAENGDFFCYRALTSSGIDLSPISSAEEFRLVQVAVERVWPDFPSPMMVLDLGGGTLELAVITPGSSFEFTSLPLGGVRMGQLFNTEKRLSASTMQVMRQYASVELRHTFERLGGLKVEAVAAVGGIMTILRDVLSSRRTHKGTPLAITRHQLEEKLDQMAKKGAPGRARDFGLSLDRADIAVPAGVVISEVLRWARTNKVYSPDVSIREGILYELADEYFGVREVVDSEESLVDAARRLGENYHYDHVHCSKVAEDCALLFDQLRPLHGLPERLRGVLRAAAIVHDIGAHVERVNHHRHGSWLIRHSNMPGVSEDDQAIIALIVRYHRRRPPSDSDKSLSHLSIEVRERVRRLVALHRVADCIDREHRSRITSLKCTLKREGVEITGKSNSSCVEEMNALPGSAKLFESIFKRSIHFDVKTE
jgi:exopolyphosphatase / guanosine-5'-triphosphate,3'-diphosphate pyrophosphatase